MGEPNTASYGESEATMAISDRRDTSAGSIGHEQLPRMEDTALDPGQPRRPWHAPVVTLSVSQTNE